MRRTAAITRTSTGRTRTTSPYRPLLHSRLLHVVTGNTGWFERVAAGVDLGMGRSPILIRVSVEWICAVLEDFLVVCEQGPDPNLGRPESLLVC